MPGKQQQPTTSVPDTRPDALEIGRRVLEWETQALFQVTQRLDAVFSRAVHLIETRIVPPAQGRLVVTGMGKSGLVAAKIAATFSSTGTPAIFLHPAEGMHGDLGAVLQGDLVLALSNSGETQEILDIVPHLQHLQTPMIGVLGRPLSTLGRACDIVLDAAIPREACLTTPAPTASTTVQLALGDALAVAVAERRGFDEQAYARLHPGGALGRRLTVRVRDIMQGGDALVPRGYLMRDALERMVETRLGAVVVIDDQGRMLGLLADGDLKRLLRRHENLLDQRIDSLMTRDPVTVTPDKMAVEALYLMENRPNQISVLPVVEHDGRAVGLLRLHDIVQAGVTLPPGQERIVEP